MIRLWCVMSGQARLSPALASSHHLVYPCSLPVHLMAIASTFSLQFIQVLVD